MYVQILSYVYCKKDRSVRVPGGSHDTITSNVCLNRFSNAIRTLL